MMIETWLYKTEKWFIVVLYKPPKVNDKSFESISSDTLQSEYSRWFVMGDMNFIWIQITHYVIYVLCITYQI